jgi:hypothetical protein
VADSRCVGRGSARQHNALTEQVQEAILKELRTVSKHELPKRSTLASSLPRGRVTIPPDIERRLPKRSHMSECSEQIHRAIQSYDDGELRDSIVRMAIRAYYDGMDSFTTRLAWR